MTIGDAVRTALPRRRRAAVLAAAGPGLLAAWLWPALAQQAGGPSDRDTIQTIADVVLIERQCPRFNVDYAKLFAFAARRGIRPVDVMPTGSRRESLDAALVWRTRQTTARDLCGDFATDREAAVPGVLTQR